MPVEFFLMVAQWTSPSVRRCSSVLLPQGVSLSRERGLKQRAGDQVAAGFFAGLAAGLAAGFLAAGFRALLAGLRATGLMLVGAPAATLGSGSGLNWARHGGESWDLLRTMQAVTRSTSGMSELQSRNASPVQACSCSGV
jgi:hypothetical protein